MKKTIVLSVVVALIFASCKKDGKACWQCWDAAGYDAAGVLFCDVTKAEAEEKFPGAWFYRQGEKKYCWRFEDGSRTYYVLNMPESIKDRYVTAGVYRNFTKVDCNRICYCEWIEKHKGKLTGDFNPNRGIKEFLLSADTCSKLSVGRVVIIRETTDSLITRELITKKP